MFLDETSIERPIVMGSYGIGPGRVMAASVEQRSDETSIVWPEEIAPYDIHVVALASGSPEIAGMATTVAEELSAGYDVLLDDRDARPGEKFADADLVGSPIRITVGKKTLEDGAVDVRRRVAGADDSEMRVPLSSVTTHVKGS